MPPASLTQRMHPEACIDGFTQHDGVVSFYSFVWACIFRTGASRVLDYGAGRGVQFLRNTAEGGSLYRRHLLDMRNTGVRVTACDIDSAVLEHPCSDEQRRVPPDQPLPFEDESFDVIVCDNVLEHIQMPGFTASELLRVLRPSGYVCARTPSRYGYVALAASLVPNRLHTAVLRRAQPHKKAEDTFPTVYGMNTPSQLSRLFPDCAVYHYYISGAPAYSFDNALLYRMFALLHRLLPGPLNTTMCAFIRKPGPGTEMPPERSGS